MKTNTLPRLAAGLLAVLLGATAAHAAAPSGKADVVTLPTVQVRPGVAWVGTPYNERIVDLPAITVRPDALTRLQARALDAAAQLPDLEPVALDRPGLELPRAEVLSRAMPVVAGGL